MSIPNPLLYLLNLVIHHFMEESIRNNLFLEDDLPSPAPFRCLDKSNSCLVDDVLNEVHSSFVDVLEGLEYLGNYTYVL